MRELTSPVTSIKELVAGQQHSRFIVAGLYSIVEGFFFFKVKILRHIRSALIKWSIAEWGVTRSVFSPSVLLSYIY